MSTTAPDSMPPFNPAYQAETKERAAEPRSAAKDKMEMATSLILRANARDEVAFVKQRITVGQTINPAREFDALKNYLLMLIDDLKDHPDLSEGIQAIREELEKESKIVFGTDILFTSPDYLIRKFIALRNELTNLIMRYPDREKLREYVEKSHFNQVPGAPLYSEVFGATEWKITILVALGDRASIKKAIEIAVNNGDMGLAARIFAHCKPQDRLNLYTHDLGRILGLMTPRALAFDLLIPIFNMPTAIPVTLKDGEFWVTSIGGDQKADAVLSLLTKAQSDFYKSFAIAMSKKETKEFPGLVTDLIEQAKIAFSDNFLTRSYLLSKLGLICVKQNLIDLVINIIIEVNPYIKNDKDSEHTLIERLMVFWLENPNVTLSTEQWQKLSRSYHELPLATRREMYWNINNLLATKFSNEKDKSNLIEFLNFNLRQDPAEFESFLRDLAQEHLSPNFERILVYFGFKDFKNPNAEHVQEALKIYQEAFMRASAQPLLPSRAEEVIRLAQICIEMDPKLRG